MGGKERERTTAAAFFGFAALKAAVLLGEDEQRTHALRRGAVGAVARGLPDSQRLHRRRWAGCRKLPRERRGRRAGKDLFKAAFVAAVFEWRRVFDLFDRDSDGWISNADLQKRPEFSFDKALKIKRESARLSARGKRRPRGRQRSRGAEGGVVFCVSGFDRDRNNLIDFGEFVEGLYEASLRSFR